MFELQYVMSHVYGPTFTRSCCAVRYVDKVHSADKRFPLIQREMVTRLFDVLARGYSSSKPTHLFAQLGLLRTHAYCSDVSGNF
jgi:hypothetical protein